MGTDQTPSRWNGCDHSGPPGHVSQCSIALSKRDKPLLHSSSLLIHGDTEITTWVEGLIDPCKYDPSLSDLLLSPFPDLFSTQVLELCLTPLIPPKWDLFLLSAETWFSNYSSGNLGIPWSIPGASIHFEDRVKKGGLLGPFLTPLFHHSNYASFLLDVGISGHTWISNSDEEPVRLAKSRRRRGCLSSVTHPSHTFTGRMGTALPWVFPASTSRLWGACARAKHVTQQHLCLMWPSTTSP